MGRVSLPTGPRSNLMRLFDPGQVFVEFGQVRPIPMARKRPTCSLRVVAGGAATSRSDTPAGPHGTTTRRRPATPWRRPAAPRGNGRHGCSAQDPPYEMRFDHRPIVSVRRDDMPIQLPSRVGGLLCIGVSHRRLPTQRCPRRRRTNCSFVPARVKWPNARPRIEPENTRACEQE